jgi:uncharacterized membrane protein YidH (DUF202 family)
MPDLSWSGWSTVVSILVTLIPALYRFRDVLLKAQDLITETVGIIVLLGGLFVYAVTMPQWLQMQDQIARLSATSNPTLGDDLRSLHTLFFGSIGLMLLGGLLIVFGLLGRALAGTHTRKK